VASSSRSGLQDITMRRIHSQSKIDPSQIFDFSYLPAR
jgi:hypothetical protein